MRHNKTYITDLLPPGLTGVERRRAYQREYQKQHRKEAAQRQRRKRNRDRWGNEEGRQGIMERTRWTAHAIQMLPTEKSIRVFEKILSGEYTLVGF